ncbi:MAG: hypothetical protein ACRBDL_11660 [Alphaproteobacteria bacterium]
MAYALAALFENEAIDLRQFTILRPENTLEIIDYQDIANRGKATGLGIGDLIELSPERLVKQWLTAEMPFDIKIENDEHFLSVSEKIYSDYIFYNPENEEASLQWQELTAQLENFRGNLVENVDKAIEQTFGDIPHPDVNLEIFEAVHQIQRLITLRNDLGMCDFNEDQIQDMTRSLAISFFYNNEANSQIRSHVQNAIQQAIQDDNEIDALARTKKETKKNIQVSGGQGAGKTLLSRRTLGIKRDEDEPYIRINKDLFRPLVLSAEDAQKDLDLSQAADRRQYGRITEDELNMIKQKQWQIIAEYSEQDKLPQMLIDSTAVGDDVKAELLANDHAKLTLLYINTPFADAKRRIQERALGDGIPGVDSMRESLHSEMISGHMYSSVEAASMLIHSVGKPIKLKILDGQSAEKTRPVMAQAKLAQGTLDIYSARAILDVFHKAEEGKTDLPPTQEDLESQVRNFEKIAAVMSEINFIDRQSNQPIARYNNTVGLQILDQGLYEDEIKDTITDSVFTQLNEFHTSRKAVMLREIANHQGRVFEERRNFQKDEPLSIITDQYETEVPLVDRSSYVNDNENSRILEWRHLAKRGKFLDGGFDPWRDKAPTDMRMLAARQVVDHWLTDDIVEQIVDRSAQQVRDTGTDSSTTVHIAHPLKDYTRPGVNINYMVLAYRSELTERLNNAMEQRHQDLDVNFAADRPMLALASDRSTRTTATALQRLTSQPFYDPDIFDDGEFILFADEHVQAGGVMLAARNIQNSRDINVVGYTALSSHNLGADLRINSNISIALETAIEDNARINDADPRQYTQELDTALTEVGLSRDTLSNIEGLILIAYFIDGQHEAKRAWFEGVKDSAGLSEEDVREGMDSLQAILLQDAITPRELANDMEEQIMTSRKAVYPSMGLE